jgi:FkbM family methyltransferase
VFDPIRAVVDVGANVGFVARFLALPCRSTVTAFEPSAENYAALVRNTAGIANIRCIKKAVGEEIGTATFLDNATVCSHVVNKKSTSKNLTDVIMTTIDDESTADVGLIKIDVEGLGNPR